MESINKRNYGIELLRLVLMFMVCMLHTLGQGGVLSSCTSDLNYNVFWLLEIISYCAVDGFAIISGYTAQNKPRRFERLVELWFQAFFYSFVLTVILTLFGLNQSTDTEGIIRSAFPVLFGNFWYFTAFFLLFFAIPIINRFLFELSIENAKKAFVICIVLFTVLGIISDPFNSGAGYSAIWLIALYCIGLLAKRIELFKKKSSASLILIWALCIFITWFVLVEVNDSKLVNYISPTILFSGLIMVVLFSRLKLKGNIIKHLAPLAFGIYLCQLNVVIWHDGIRGSAAFVNEEELGLGVAILYVFLFAAAIFFVGLGVEFVRSQLARLFKIGALSKKIVTGFDFIIRKIAIIFR